ncbi:hypothetical protein LPB86_04525 [Pedobacter sp. MC2016-14]|uniref:hypothetical protein n=1 Tax=Pedobacter sp. MC2016-14 TaxID=2897327 RepID=UPI001E484A44|nr:hypothetical protein [Pedobacter sp. MC2016-14]MCD0487479.1 hypothetical protein [Pedobacter sp. MC2016-14]
MLQNLPVYLTIVFILTTALSVVLVLLLINTASKPIDNQVKIRIVSTIIIWLTIQAVLSYTGLYRDFPAAIPPKIVLFGIAPAILAIIMIFSTRSGKLFIERLSMQMLSYVHLIRIPVELVLYGLFLNGAVPELMTFEGRNLDILAGLTAPLVGFFGIGKSKMGKVPLLAWNFICLGLLINIVVNAILSAPSPFQQFAHEQPNVAILNFPFSWLPGFIVPLVLFAHLAAIKKLIKR